MWLALLIPGVANCAGDDCVAAAVKLADDCSMGQGHTAIPREGAIRRCDGKTACHATCVNNASCDQITSTEMDPNKNSYVKCLNDCDKP